MNLGIGLGKDLGKDLGMDLRMITKVARRLLTILIPKIWLKKPKWKNIIRFVT